MKQALDPEVLDNLEHLESDLLAYETGLSRGRDETARVQFIFRYAHNLKSSLGMLGFSGASDLLHRVESCFDLVRNAKRKATSDLARASLATLDLVRVHLDSDGTTPPPDPTAVLGVLQSFLEAQTGEDTAVDLPFRLTWAQAETAAREVAGGRSLWLVEKLVTTDIDEEFFSILPCFSQAADFGTLVAFRPGWANLPKDRRECVIQLLVAGPADPAAAAKAFRDSFRVVHPPRPSRVYDGATLDPNTAAFLQGRGFRPLADWPPPGRASWSWAPPAGGNRCRPGSTA
jgi:chemotaxis protein histidine kinase CheA